MEKLNEETLFMMFCKDVDVHIDEFGAKQHIEVRHGYRLLLRIRDDSGEINRSAHAVSGRGNEKLSHYKYIRYLFEYALQHSDTLCSGDTLIEQIATATLGDTTIRVGEAEEKK